ncbi:MAG: GntR family transcriptional regulator [Pseudomonadota bacterium]
MRPASSNRADEAKSGARTIEQSKRKTKADIAAEQIEAAIVNCELAPGAVIVEADLTEWLGLGRTPVREALVTLANANLLRLGRGGVVIPELNAMTMLKLLELREPIERLCIEKAIDRKTAADTVDFADLVRVLGDVSAADRPAFMAVLWDIHKALATASQNEFIHTALRTTQGLSRRYWGHYADEDQQARAAEIYAGLLQALLDSDTPAALGQSEELMRYLRQFTLGTMQKMAGE